ncbi:MAG: DUF1926 domain-containing protein [Chloroflexi bacterium]|nr:DUF1926 domain-containing protein [Chloroflexota bacterium]
MNSSHAPPSDQHRMFLGLAIHNHQPVGNFPTVFAMAYEKAYSPMVEALERHPRVRLSMHYSGPLLDWLRSHRPDFIHRVAALAGRGQIEIVGGAYYEPILPSIPDADRVGQTALMADVCEREFGQRPAGFWLAERVWEPDLPRALFQCGVQWTIVDDSHFKMVGLDDEDLFGYYLTEDQGFPVKVYATSKFLRYSVPFRPVEQVIGFLRAHASEGRHPIAVMGDDGEKFGLWPHTYDHCWGPDGWVEKLLVALEGNQEWLQTKPLGEFARQYTPLGRIYLPSASYDEMLEWSLPTASSKEFVDVKRRMEAEGKNDVLPYMRAGYWRNFLVKYPEANWMHKKMLRVHGKVYRAPFVDGARPGIEELWKAQCNCPYWHGVFGGLYLSDIRAATYQHLLTAEQQADNAMHAGRTRLGWEQADFDMDGHDELLVDGTDLSLYFTPHHGGSLAEWDLRDPPFNVLCTIARRPEAYHRELAQAERQPAGTQTIHAGIQLKDPRAARLLAYDKYPRYSMVDHFLKPAVNLNNFAACDYEDMGAFAGHPYETKVEGVGSKLTLTFKRTADLHYEESAVPFEVSRTVVLETGQRVLNIVYRIRNLGNKVVSAVFGVEWNINLLGGGHNDQAYYEVPGLSLDDWRLDSTGELPKLAHIIMGNRYLGIRLHLEVRPEAEVWRFPVETATNSEAGVEGLYQASCVLVRIPFTLAPQQETSTGMIWSQEPAQRD